MARARSCDPFSARQKRRRALPVWAGVGWRLQSADSAHLTLPVAGATGPLPLHPKGREGTPILVGSPRAHRRDHQGCHCSRSGLRDSRDARYPGCGWRLLSLAASVARRRVQSRAYDRDRRNRRRKFRSDAAAENGARLEVRAEPATSSFRLRYQPAAGAERAAFASSVPTDRPYLPLCPLGAERAGERWGSPEG
jgi:hypothetical protein